MKKTSSLLLKLAAFYLLLMGCLFVIFSFLSNNKPASITNIDNISVNSIDENYESYYIEKLYILERYAFETIDEYEDIESGYTDTTFFVYSDDQPMDEHELFDEFFIVKFYDNSGEPHLASLASRASKGMSQILNSCTDSSYSLENPLTISACVSAANTSNVTYLNNWEKELDTLREDSLNTFSAESGIPYEGIQMIYKYESVDAYEEGEAADTASTKTMLRVFGIILITGGILLIKHSKKKNGVA